MRLPWQHGLPEGDASATAGAAGQATPQTCLSLSRALERCPQDERAEIVDLGPFSGSSAVYLAGRGARVSVVDFAPPPQRLKVDPDTGEELAPPEPFRLEHDSESFHLVLAWEALDFTPRNRLEEVCAEIERVLRPGGAVLVFTLGQKLAGNSPLALPARFRVVADDQIVREPLGELGWTRHVHPARDVERLLAPLSILGAHLQRNQTREIIAVKRQS